MSKVKKATDRNSSVNPLQITHCKGYVKGNDVIDPELRIKCGCCLNVVTISHNETPESKPTYLKINGVFGTIEQWKAILLPLLGM